MVNIIATLTILIRDVKLYTFIVFDFLLEGITELNLILENAFRKKFNNYRWTNNLSQF